MKQITFCLLLALIATVGYTQNEPKEKFKINNTALRFSLNGFRIGIEQKILPRTTLQIEGMYLGSKMAKVCPQIKYYPKFFKKRMSYFGLGYLYKHKENDFADSVRITRTNNYYVKRFSISKYISALTLNYGFLFDQEIFKRQFHFECNFGAGLRFKKSNRYGLLNNEEIDLREAFIMRPQAYEDTKGKFALYPEINIMLTLVLPLKK